MLNNAVLITAYLVGDPSITDGEKTIEPKAFSRFEATKHAVASGSMSEMARVQANRGYVKRPDLPGLSGTLAQSQQINALAEHGVVLYLRVRTDIT